MCPILRYTRQCMQLFLEPALGGRTMFKFVAVLLAVLCALVVSLDGAAGRKLSRFIKDPPCGAVGSACCSDGKPSCGTHGICCAGKCHAGSCPDVRSLLHCSLLTSIWVFCVFVLLCFLVLHFNTFFASGSLLSGMFVLVPVASCCTCSDPYMH
jgi:hypothetical protein